jgi:photolyase PhrII
MRTAVRAEENPALDVAIHLGNRLDLPVFVYHALSERYPYASDRHHTFVLQGARDVQRRLQDREIAYAFHLERAGQRGPHLRSLGERASIVVTEEMPTPPLSRWTELLSRQLDCPVAAVDTACVVPMQRIGKAYDRAFAYRKATETLYADRVSQPAREVEPIQPASLANDLPFRPIDLQSADLAALVAGCEIDHSIGPVPETVGGSSAGYTRWDRFRRNGLRQYHQRRNSPLVDGVSRLSPYLHCGMVAPQRIAREAAEAGGEGAEKYLDELLIWRELAYAFCFYRPDHTRLSVLPSWAQQTLHEHAEDPRPALFDWETLARGRTGDAVWDAAQRSLLIHGELHNNVRMTWGKAVLQWTAGPRKALNMLID